MTYYQSAREVGGDLYDFLPFKDGCLWLVIGDVADKGMPSALVMASTRSMLRTTSRERRTI
jgi:serine phosphatase RsbU (regulator of sigma subunit)